MKELRPLAEQGHARAQNGLGVMYDRGLGVTQDYAEAMKWYRRAAEQGYVGAQLETGLIYSHGLDAPQDLIQAHMWFNLAAEQGNTLGRKYRDSVAKKMTPADISKAQAMAREWSKAHQE